MIPSRVSTATALGALFLATTCLAAPRVANRAQAHAAASTATASEPKTRAMTLEEARAAVTLLDEGYQTELEEIHRWYPIKSGQPVVAAAVVRRVQEQMVAKGWPRSRFLAVNASVMNPNHVPRDDFERGAVEKIREGAERVETIEKGRLRVATLVPMTGGCASCHWTPGTSGSKGAITWTIPLKK